MSALRKAFVIGWPIAHSRSPLIHTHWLETYGLSGSYEKIAVEPDRLAAFIASAREEGFVGGNVTIPHKIGVAALCDELSERARRLGSVNTIWYEDQRLCGDTTDGHGFLAALDQEQPEWRAHRRQALVLGAGGAAPPIVDALVSQGFETVIVANRTFAKAEALARTMSCAAVPLSDIASHLATTDLLVNTTAAGLDGSSDLALDLAALPDHAIVDDIVYVPRVTPLLAAAGARGLATVGGLGMLLHQAVPGFSRWFGITPEVTPELRRLVEADIDAGAR